MRLLILTQAVDRNDPVLGFFHRWIEEFAKQCDTVIVICLRKGLYSLPHNVSIYSLGKEAGKGRAVYLIRFFKFIIHLRRDYDAVFVHMNPEYVVLGSLLWKLWHKRVMLWYVHKSVTLALRIAAFLADAVVTASKESFRLPSRKVRVVSHGIDTEFFSPDPRVAREGWWLSVGRLSPVKRHDLAIRKAVEAHTELRIAGDGPERTSLETLARSLGATVTFLGPLSHERLRDEYRRAALLVHTSETGSLDKVLLEALACGLPIMTSDPALQFLVNEGPEYVKSNHSLSDLIVRIMDFYVHSPGR